MGGGEGWVRGRRGEGYGMRGEARGIRLKKGWGGKGTRGEDGNKREKMAIKGIRRSREGIKKTE